MRRTVTLLGALVLVTGAWTIGSARADAVAWQRAAAGGTRGSSFSSAEQRAALRFWTAKRLRAARELTAPAGRAGHAAPARAQAPKGPQVRIPAAAAPGSAPRLAKAGSAAALLASSPQPWTGGGLISTTAGKVFFQRADGGTFACSATVANSDNRSVVLTAGHCVVDGRTGEVYRNWVFIPGYANGNRPYGTFAANQLFHLAQYVSTGGDANWDLAFAVVGRVNGRSLVDTVGAEGIAFNSASGRHVHSFGYGGSPEEGNGQRLNHCEGDEFSDAGRPGSTLWGIDCVQTGGSSGGGFLADFDTASGGGYLVGNISVSAGSNEYHPYLGNEALDLYRRAGSA